MQSINESLAFDMLKNKTKLFTVYEENLKGSAIFDKAYYTTRAEVQALTFATDESDGQSKMALVLSNGSVHIIDKLDNVFTSEAEATSYLKQLAAENGYTVYTAATSGVVSVLVLGKDACKIAAECACETQSY